MWHITSRFNSKKRFLSGLRRVSALILRTVLQSLERSAACLAGFNSHYILLWSNISFSSDWPVCKLAKPFANHAQVRFWGRTLFSIFSPGRQNHWGPYCRSEGGRQAQDFLPKCNRLLQIGDHRLSVKAWCRFHQLTFDCCNFRNCVRQCNESGYLAI